jgi:hypothetical protein
MMSRAEKWLRDEFRHGYMRGAVSSPYSFPRADGDSALVRFLVPGPGAGSPQSLCALFLAWSNLRSRSRTTAPLFRFGPSPVGADGGRPTTR